MESGPRWRPARGEQGAGATPPRQPAKCRRYFVELGCIAGRTILRNSWRNCMGSVNVWRTVADANAEQSYRGSPSDNFSLLAIAGAVVFLHVLTNGRYGFHRDELQFLSDARHLDWGFVAYPPFTPLVERISLAIFGVSLVGLRLFSVITQSAAIVVTGLMASDLGGGRLAQITAALAVALSALPLFEGTEFQYSSFDY